MLDNSTHKTKKTEYPFLSKRQFNRRYKKEIYPIELLKNNLTLSGVPYGSKSLIIDEEEFKKLTIKQQIEKGIDPNENLNSLDAEYTRPEENKVWADKVKKKDNYTCQNPECKNKTYLHAHHVESYVDNPELRYEISNGIILCGWCHLEFHDLYGRGNNTRKQLDEWLSTKIEKIKIT